MEYTSQYWTQKLEELERRVTSEQRLSHPTVIEWVADCVSVFSHLGLDSVLIKGFVESFNGENERQRNIFVNNWMSVDKQQFRINGFFYPNIAFKTAKLLVHSIGESERLIPLNLIELLQSKPEYGNLVYSLKAMQVAYEAKADGVPSLLAATNTLLIDILKIQPLPNNSTKLSNQLDYLKENQSYLAENYGVDTELIKVFSIFKYLRDKTVEHKMEPGAGIPLPVPPHSVAYGFACLVLLLLYGTITAGKLITFEPKIAK